MAGLERQAGELAGRVVKEAGGWLVVERVPGAGGDDLRRVASAVRDRVGAGPGVVVLASETRARRPWSPSSPPTWSPQGPRPGTSCSEAAKAVGGGAGGKGDLASAGGRDPGQLEEALRIARADALEILRGAAGG